MRVIRSYKVEITFPCSDEDWKKLTRLRMDSQRQEVQESDRGCLELTPIESEVLQAIPVHKEEIMSTPTLDLMRKAGLGRMNLSGLVRDLVAEKPGMSRQDLVDLIEDRYPNRWAPYQIVGTINTQTQKGNIVSSRGRFYSSINEAPEEKRSVPVRRNKMKLNRSELVRQYVRANPGLKQQEVVNGILGNHPELESYSLNGIISSLRYQKKQLLSREGHLFMNE